MVWRALGAERLLFLGSSPAVEEIIAHVADHPELGLAPIGYLEERAIGARTLNGTPRLGVIEDLEEIIAVQSLDGIVVGASRSERLPVERLIDLRFSGLNIEDASSTYETIFRRVSSLELRPSDLVLSSRLEPRTAEMTLQTLYSVVLAAAGFVILLPILASIALAVKLSSPGPILMREPRLGLNGAPLTLFRFRTSYQSGDDAPRVTSVGSWLLRLHLDELPQLLNVLRGEISIIGPRPERVEFAEALEKLIPFYSQRNSVKPGITGWAQINAPRRQEMEDAIMELEYDLYYIKNISLSLDAYIALQTIKLILFDRPAS
jgi:lipopolysaccharide/colanic/teichoic acid biosynthesis glycosyltransferase